jgi:cytochrome P450
MYEALRLYSPAEGIPKMAVGDQHLGDYVIPDGSYVYLHAFRVQYNPKHWGEDARIFRPERWFVDPQCASSAAYCYQKTSDTVLKSFFKFTRYAFIPFSDGPRSCLGRRFAEVEFMTAIVELIRHLEFSVPIGTKQEELLKGDVTVTFRPTQPIELIVKPRSG